MAGDVLDAHWGQAHASWGMAAARVRNPSPLANSLSTIRFATGHLNRNLDLIGRHHGLMLGVADLHGKTQPAYVQNSVGRKQVRSGGRPVMFQRQTSLYRLDC